MKSLLRIIIISALLLPGRGTAFSQYTTARDKWDFYLKLSRMYCPTANGILSGVDDWENCVVYAGKASTDKTLVSNFNTVVHETLHGFDFQQDGFYIEPGYIIPVKEGSVYKSNELNSVVPLKLQEKIFRYSTYVGEKSNLSSNVNGIYGMLGEFSAYYHGALASLQLREWYEKKFGYSNPDPWVDEFIAEAGSSIQAFYEFRLFMAWYLEYAQKKHPEVYADLMKNTSFRMAYTELYHRFDELSKEYEFIVDDIVLKLNEAGNEVKNEGGFTRVYDGKGGYTGTGNFLEDIAWLKSLYTPQLEKISRTFEVPLSVNKQ